MHYEQQRIFQPSDEHEYFFKSWQEKGLCEESVQEFRRIIYDYYEIKRRPFAWRDVIVPYHVLVSEVMLQQTQTHRVAEKFPPFIVAFPDYAALAHAPFEHVLSLWKGLGYNRRALALKQCALKIVTEYDGVLPDEVDTLVHFPGIGPHTAASIVAFAFNKPTLFLETNIRTVLIHFFFRHEQLVHDRQLIPIARAVLDTEQPRDWYYALMDYGVMLKKKVVNPTRKSVHYKKQSRFDGSDRQIRGRVLALLLAYRSLAYDHMVVMLKEEELRVARILESLVRDGLLHFDGISYRLA
jgi:A/G-specific adenine glycosylase